MIIATLAVIGIGFCAIATLIYNLAPEGPGRASAENHALGFMAAGVAVLCFAAAADSTSPH